MSEKISYVGEFFSHRYNQIAMLGAACTAVFASIPYGWNGFALVTVLALGTEVIAALTLPDLPSFRSSVNTRLGRQTRESRRAALLEELKVYGDRPSMASYEHMCGRVMALYKTAGDSRSALTRGDVENLDNLTVDFLGLCVLSLSLKTRKEMASEESVQKKMNLIEVQLNRNAIPADEERQLRRTMAQYAEVLQRARRLAVRRNSLEATLMSMPDKMEEVYQLVMSSPYSSDIGAELEQSLARLRIAEEVAAEFDEADSFDVERAAYPVTQTHATVSQPSPATRRSPQSAKN